MKQLLKDIIIDQKSFLPSKKTIIRIFSEKYLNNEEIIIISGGFVGTMKEFWALFLSIANKVDKKEP